MARSTLNQKQLQVSGAIIGAESVAISTTAQSLADHGFTVPAKTTRIVLVAAAKTYWHPTGTPSSSFGHVVEAGEIFQLNHSQHEALIAADSSTPDLTAIYFR